MSSGLSGSSTVLCKEIPFASHIKYYPSSGIPASYLSYAFANPIAGSGFGGATDATNLFIHAIFDNPSGTGVDVENNVIPFTGASNGIPAINVNQIQAALNTLLVANGYAANDAIYTITNSNEIALWLSPALVAVLPNLNVWAGDSLTAGSYQNKVDVDTLYTYTHADIQLSPIPTNGCTPIQEIKYRNSCTGLETYKYVVEDLAGNLVLASSVITGFDESLIQLSCNSVVNETANGVQFTGTSSFILPADVISFTVSAQAGAFDLSFDNGATFALKNRKGSRTWGQGTINIISNSSSILIQGSNASSDIDIIWEV